MVRTAIRHYPKENQHKTTSRVVLNDRNGTGGGAVALVTYRKRQAVQVADAFSALWLTRTIGQICGLLYEW